MKYNVNSNGFYGDFGGAYIPEMLFFSVCKKNLLQTGLEWLVLTIMQN